MLVQMNCNVSAFIASVVSSVYSACCMTMFFDSSAAFIMRIV